MARRVAALEAAATALADRGYEATRFADVAAATGTAVSTLQSYFGTRENMLVEAMRHATEVELGALDALARAERDPWDRLVAMIDRNLDAPPRHHLLFLECWRSAIRDTKLRDYSEEGWERYFAPFARLVAEGRDAGVFAPIGSPEDVADVLLAALVGAVIPRLLNFPSPSAERLRAALLRQAATMLGRPG
jgi:AcrR family transcriptional regulator